MHDELLSQPSGTALIETEQQPRYPGLRVRRDGDAVVVHIPAKFRRRNGRQMILTNGEPFDPAQGRPADPAKGKAASAPNREVNITLIKAIAKAHHWQEQLESGEYPSLEDLAQAIGADRTYVGRMLRLTSLAPDITEAILGGKEPEGISLRKLQKGLPVCWHKQRKRWLLGR